MIKIIISLKLEDLFYHILHMKAYIYKKIDYTKDPSPVKSFPNFVT